MLLLTVPTLALQSDADQPIHIEGDANQVDQTNQTIVYTGTVEVVQGTLRVRGDRLVVKVIDNEVERITTFGSPASYQQQLDDDEGIVSAHAQTIVYHTRDERIFLKGGASLEQQGNKLSGESIRYDIVAGKIDANTGTNKQGRVRMEFDPSTRRKSDADSD